jgi:proton-translocating NADH-quinone oxidoreductase chain M
MIDIPNLIPITLLLTFGGALATYTASAQNAKVVALIASIPALVTTSWMFAQVGFGSGAGYSFVTDWEWIPALGIGLTFGVDGLSASLAWLTALLTPLVIIYSWKEKHHPRFFFSLLLVLNGTVIGVFTALDLFLFYIFWEFVLIPMYFLIAKWGGEDRQYASTKFFVYTGSASLIMLLGFMALYFGVGIGSFSIPALTAAGSSLGFAKDFGLIVFGVLALGFLVKMPSVPFHTWLPDAHVQAPTAGSVMLAGVMLKMGSYGLMRIAFPMLPDAAQSYAWVFFVLGTVSVLYGAFLCLAQDDLKSMIAYSSVSHMGMITIAMATFNELGWAGAAYMNVAHGVISAGLFMAAGSLQHSTGTRKISKLGGLAQKAPILTALTATLFMASLGLPGLMGFVAEFTIFAGIYQAFGNWIWLPIWSILITAGYFLWALQRAYFGPIRGMVDSDKVHDVPKEEQYTMFALIAIAIVLGVLPAILLGQINDWTVDILSFLGAN